MIQKFSGSGSTLHIPNLLSSLIPNNQTPFETPNQRPARPPREFKFIDHGDVQIFNAIPNQEEHFSTVVVIEVEKNSDSESPELNFYDQIVSRSFKGYNHNFSKGPRLQSGNGANPNYSHPKKERISPTNLRSNNSGQRLGKTEGTLSGSNSRQNPTNNRLGCNGTKLQHSNSEPRNLKAAHESNSCTFSEGKQDALPSFTEYQNSEGSLLSKESSSEIGYDDENATTSSASLHSESTFHSSDKVTIEN